MEKPTSAQRKYLRSLAHSLDPVVLIGHRGLTGAVVHAAYEALDAHELIKVRFNAHKDEKRALTAELAERTGAHVAGMIGHVAILYREHRDPEQRKIVLPKS